MSNLSNRLSQGVKPMLPEEIKGKGSHNCQINQSVTLTQRGRIFLQGDIFAPVEAILNLPMLPDTTGKLGGIGCQRTDIKPPSVKRVCLPLVRCVRLESLVGERPN
jgi:hypothetical protein